MSKKEIEKEYEYNKYPKILKDIGKLKVLDGEYFNRLRKFKRDKINPEGGGYGYNSYSLRYITMYVFDPSKVKKKLKAPLKTMESKWLITINKCGGKALPTENCLLNLMIKGLVELELTEKGKKELERASRL